MNIARALNKHFPDKESAGWIPYSSGICSTQDCKSPNAYECGSDGRCLECAKQMARGIVMPQKSSTSTLDIYNPKTGEKQGSLQIDDTTTLGDFANMMMEMEN